MRLLRAILPVLVLLAGAGGARASLPVSVAANDDCKGAKSLGDGGTTSGNTATAVDNTNAANGEGFVAPDLVYSFTLTTARQVLVSAAGDRIPYIPVLYVRRVCIDVDSELGFSDLGLPVRLNLAAGKYFVIVDGDRGSYFDRGPFTLSFETRAPANGDLCTAPLPIAAGRSATGRTDDLGADYSSTNVPSAGPDVVFQMTLPSNSHVRLRVESADFDTVLYVRRACANAASEVAWNDDASASTYVSAIDTRLDAGTYFVFVDGYFDLAGGNYELRLDVGA